MSVVETNKVDAVAARPDSSIVKLVITDHLEWEDFEAHALLIQDKINTYLEFVESGQLAQIQTPKIPEAPDIHIVLMLQYPPTNEAMEFFGRVRELLAGMGMKFDVEVD
ncbi:MAG TPA: DUF6572 domain-containing protein [Kofleriaceae bacterium]|nr:DUF6572 domain-containing protein [Kofleriaceae bacterium]